MVAGIEMQELGYNCRLTDFRAALGISQLERAKAGLERRHEIVRRYNEAFSGIDGIKTPFKMLPMSIMLIYLYIIQVADRLGYKLSAREQCLCAGSLLLRFI